VAERLWTYFFLFSDRHFSAAMEVYFAKRRSMASPSPPPTLHSVSAPDTGKERIVGTAAAFAQPGM
jgi:hypothetical protein